MESEEVQLDDDEEVATKKTKTDMPIPTTVMDAEFDLESEERRSVEERTLLQKETFQKYRVVKDWNATMGEYFGIQNVTSSALDSIRIMSSTRDTRLYERAKQNFPYSMWE